MFRYFNEGLPLPQDLAATLPEAVIAPFGGSTLQDPYLQKLCCELLDLGKYELCCRYFEGAPAGAQLLSAQPPQITSTGSLCGLQIDDWTDGLLRDYWAQTTKALFWGQKPEHF